MNPTLTDREPRLGGRGPADIPPGGWGGGDGGDGAPDFGGRLRRARIGIIVAMIPVLMLFMGFTSAYVLRQGATSLDAATGAYASDWRTLQLPGVLWVNTLILLVSSVTLELARRQLFRQFATAPAAAILGAGRASDRPLLPWLELTVVLGAGFMAGQWLAWRNLAEQGIYVSTNPSSSFFYVLTASHALHLAGGLLALVYAAAIALRGRSLEKRRLVVEVTALYWHFMGVLWVYLFALLLLAK